MTNKRLIEIINTVYHIEGFKGVIEEVQDRLVYGTVKKTNGLYCISTGGWSDDEALLDALISPMTRFHYHYVGYLVGGHFYFSEDKSFECFEQIEIIKGGNKKDIERALNWYRYLPQHIMRVEDVQAQHRLENYIKEKEKTG